MLIVDPKRLPERQIEVLGLTAVDQRIQQRVGEEQHVCDAIHIVFDCDVVREQGIHTRWQI